MVFFFVITSKLALASYTGEWTRDSNSLFNSQVAVVVFVVESYCSLTFWFAFYHCPLGQSRVGTKKSTPELMSLILALDRLADPSMLKLARQVRVAREFDTSKIALISIEERCVLQLSAPYLLLQWFSNDRMTGYSERTNAVSRIWYSTSCKGITLCMNKMAFWKISRTRASPKNLRKKWVSHLAQYPKKHIGAHSFAVRDDWFALVLSRSVPTIKLDATAAVEKYL